MMTNPTRPAPVVVIDLQTGMFDGVAFPPMNKADALVDKVRALLRWARGNGHPVAFIRHDGSVGSGDPLEPGTPGWPVWAALGQAPDEPTFGKNVGDAFSNPDFVDWLRTQSDGAVILLGAQSEYCVTATVGGALDHGYRVAVVSDAHGTWDQEGETADVIIARQNAAFAARGATLVTAAALIGS